MTEIGQLPRELIEIILAKLDCEYDISNCALVCRQWLDIINHHRAIESTIRFGPRTNSQIHGQHLRRFKNICFRGFRFMFPEIDIITVVCQEAQVVIIDNCYFTNLNELKRVIMACGDLTRLEITNCILADDDFTESAQIQTKPKIETLALRSRMDGWCLLKVFQEHLIEVANIELTGQVNYDSAELALFLCFLDGHHDKVRELNVFKHNDYGQFERLKWLAPRIKLKKLSVCCFVDAAFIRRQPSITDLRFIGTPINVMECTFRSLPMLTELELSSTSIAQFNVIRENVHRLAGTLSSLDLAFFTNCSFDIGLHSTAEWDITFIVRLSKLRKFSCRFRDAFLTQGTFVKLDAFETPTMLHMKEFHLEYKRKKYLEHHQHLDIDAGAISHQMPNLEKITLYEIHRSNLKPVRFGTLATLKELYINALIVHDDEAIQSMKFPNLRYLKLTKILLSPPGHVMVGRKMKESAIPQIALNCPLLSRIRFSCGGVSTLFKRNVDDFYIASGEFPLYCY